MKEIQTTYVPEMNAHVAYLEPEHGAVRVKVIIASFAKEAELAELFLYTFDADVNCIEFPFGTRLQKVAGQWSVSFETDAAIHRPPFRIEISHQLETARLEKYAFLVQYEEI